MASRYRISIEREVNRKGTTSQVKTTNLVNYDPSPEPEDQSPETSNNIEFLQARLRSKAQIEHQVRKKLSDAHANTERWRQRYQSQAERANQFREEMSNLRKRHSEEVAELHRELRWNHKKVKALERVIEENNQARSPRTLETAETIKRLGEANEMLIQENMRLSEEILLLSQSQEDHASKHEQLILELEQMKQDRQEDLINIQNLENAVKALHDENVILKETPIPVVLPTSQPRQRELGRNLYQCSSVRPVMPCVSLLDQRAKEKRKNTQSRRTNPLVSTTTNREVWPYSSSTEDLSWGY